MKFGQYLLKNAIPAYRRQYINYQKLKEAIKKAIVSPESANFIEKDKSDLWTSAIEEPLTANDVDFINEFQRQVQRAVSFLAVRVEICQARYTVIEENCTLYLREQRVAAENIVIGATQVAGANTPDSEIQILRLVNELRDDDEAESIREGLEESDEENNSANAKGTLISKNPEKALQKAMSEFYLLLEHVEDFRILNEIAARKILKKYAKSRKINVDDLMRLAADTMAQVSVQPKGLIRKLEDLYCKCFASASRERKKALAELKSTKHEGKKFYYDYFKSGVLTGLSLPALLGSIFYLFRNASTISKEKMFLLSIFGGLSIPILFMYIFAFLLMLLKKHRINWILIFELDPRDFLHPIQFSEIAGALLFFYSYCLLFFTLEDVLGISQIQLYPIILVAGLFMITLNPLPLFYGRSRRSVISLFGRVLLSGCMPVKFKDFFLMDLLASMTYSFVSIETAVCLAFTFPNGIERCNYSTSLPAALVTALPSYFRLVQCFRRYYDSKKVHPHISNAGKYLFALSTIAIAIVAKTTNVHTLEYVWITFSVLTSLYAYAWDVLMDWALFSKNDKHPYLRKELAFAPWVYYVGIVANFVLRFLWVIQLSPGYWNSFFQFPPLLIYGLALVEVLRRSYWAVIRLEAENSLNVGQFRVIAELPLPYAIQY